MAEDRVILHSMAFIDSDSTESPRRSNRWIFEEGAPTKLFISDSNEIWIPKSNEYREGFKCNVLFDCQQQQITGNDITFTQFDVKSISAVGLTSKQHFASGNSIKGLVFNCLGNIADGSKLLIKGFGKPWPEVTSVIVFTTFRRSNEFKLYISHNDRSLGAAFDLKSPIELELYPFVVFSKPGRARVSKSSRKVIPIEYLSRADEQFHGIEGFWSLTRYSGRKPSHRLTLSLVKGFDETYDFSVQVFNRLSGTLSRYRQDCKVIYLSHNSMPGPPDIMFEEEMIFQLFTDMTQICQIDPETLVLITASGNLDFKRCKVEPPQSSNYNPFG